MYATIRHGERGTASADELARAGCALAARLGAVPGVIAGLLLAMQAGGYAAVCICEDRAGLAAADALVAGWSPAGDAAPRGDPSRQITGEVVAQTGL